MNYFWSLTCTSVAAQLSTLPLTIYYFHQIPSYFLITNWVVIPLVFVILILSIFLLVLFYIVDLSTISGESVKLLC
ncbi:MAG: ComEC/Rec2 family competence protein [Flammeovirgaceae bacterium]|nr:ComEC/Rec2 family competence protein [Flammeovirgaceae bacterium]